MSRCSLRKKQRFFSHAAANMMDSRWRYPLDDNSRTQWISGKFDNWFLEKNKKYRICQSTSKTYEYSYFWSGKQVSFIHAHPHMSFFLLPRNPHEWSICCEWDAVSAFLWSLLSDISTSRLSWPDCTVGTPVSSCHRAVKWNMLTPQLKRHRKLVKHVWNPQTAGHHQTAVSVVVTPF